MIFLHKTYDCFLNIMHCSEHTISFLWYNKLICKQICNSNLCHGTVQLFVAWYHRPVLPHIPAVLHRNRFTSLSFTSLIRWDSAAFDVPLSSEFLLIWLESDRRATKEAEEPNGCQQPIQSDFTNSNHRGGKPSHVHCFNLSYVGQSIWLYIKRLLLAVPPSVFSLCLPSHLLTL